MGKQLDSLSDMVSFGVAPGLILYQLLRISYAREEGGLEVSILALLPAFIFTCAVAWRLAKFNIASNQTHNFKGVPSPAAGLLIASFPLIIFYEYFGIQALLINKWFLYGVILVVSWLMVSSINLMSIKFTDFSFKNNAPKFILLGVSLIMAIVLAVMSKIWLAWPVVFILYIILSLLAKEPDSVTQKSV